MIRVLALTSLLAVTGCASSVAPSYGDTALAPDSGSDADNQMRTDASIDAATTPDVARDTGVVDAGRMEYRNDFGDASAPLPEWSSRAVARTPAGNRSFLGPIGRGVASVTLAGWAPHRAMRVSLTLFVLGSWDGNHNGTGPDIWEMRPRGSTPVVHTTFANLDGSEITQSFPDDFPAGRHPSGTGAVARDTLGFFYLFRQMNAVYRIERRFTHTNATLVLEIESQDAERSNGDEEWGLDDIVIVAEP